MMSRKFEFRVWDTLEKRYNKNYHIQIGLDGSVYNSQNGAGGSDYVIQQFTGLLDKNKKKIFEYDILKVNRWHFSKPDYDIVEDGVEIGYVHYGNVEWLMSFDHIRYDDIVTLESHSDRLEVIGNVFENPELVKYR